jgi:tetratricopeptide (TPR) repeat protein
MFQPKTLHRESIPRALEKAERYRLLNEPVEAESICLDVLAADAQNQQALVILLLALTDQFEEHVPDALQRARDAVKHLRDDYERAYYAGIIAERRAKAQLKHGGPGSRHSAHDSFLEAMRWYEKAEALRPPGNDDALLRWNTCGRILQRRPDLAPAPVELGEPPLE